MNHSIYNIDALLWTHNRFQCGFTILLLVDCTNLLHILLLHMYFILNNPKSICMANNTISNIKNQEITCSSALQTTNHSH